MLRVFVLGCTCLIAEEKQNKSSEFKMTHQATANRCSLSSYSVRCSTYFVIMTTYSAVEIKKFLDYDDKYQVFWQIICLKLEVIWSEIYNETKISKRQVSSMIPTEWLYEKFKISAKMRCSNATIFRNLFDEKKIEYVANHNTLQFSCCIVNTCMEEGGKKIFLTLHRMVNRSSNFKTRTSNPEGVILIRER